MEHVQLLQLEVAETHYLSPEKPQNFVFHELRKFSKTVLKCLYEAHCMEIVADSSSTFRCGM